MKINPDILQKIEALPVPRHLFVLPRWAPPGTIDKLQDAGYVTFGHHQRDVNGALQVAMNVRLTPKGEAALEGRPRSWPSIAVKSSVAGVSFAIMSLLVLYLV